MANTTISPNMNLPIPVPAVDPGPDWATNANACFTTVDQHNHSNGQGVLIPSAGIGVNADLPYNGFNGTQYRSIRFTPQSSNLSLATDLGCLYEEGIDLWYNDGNGNQVRLTNGGNPAGGAGSITGLPSGTASASYSASTFTFQSATSTPAAISVGSVTIAQTVASGKSVTISAAATQPTNYSLTLPIAAPSANTVPLSDSSGNLSWSPHVGTTFGTAFTFNLQSGSSLTITPTTFYAYYIRIGNIVTAQATATYAVSGYTSGTSVYTVALAIPIATSSLNPTGTYLNQQFSGSQQSGFTVADFSSFVATSGNLSFTANGSSNTLCFTFTYQIS